MLLVCHANVCRSPVMQWTLRSLLTRDDLEVASAGTHVMSPVPVCDVALEVLGEAVPQQSRANTAVRLTAEEIDAADLIITATTHQRGEIALMSHGARARTFTLREALLLGDVAGRGPSVEGADLHAYAARLHASRGLLQLPPPPRRLRRAASDPLDHVDVHQERGRLHRNGLIAVRDDAVRLGEHLGSMLAG